MESLTLRCWIYGDKIDSIFDIQAPGSDTLIQLKQAIKFKHAVTFRDLDADALALYSIPMRSRHEQLGDVLKHWIPEEASELRKLLKPLSILNLSESVVVVVAPDLAERSVVVVPNVILNCWLRGQNAYRIFQVEISSTETISALRKVIKYTKQVDLHDVQASVLALHRVSLPIDDGFEGTLEELTLNDDDLLRPDGRVSDILTEPDHLHVIVDVPSSVRLPTYFSPLHAIGNRRTEFLRLNEPVDPSYGARSEVFATRQNNPSQAIPCGRPRTPEETIPVTLLHVAFSQFLDDCQTHEVTQADYAFAAELYSATSNSQLYSHESRAEVIHKVMARHGLHFVTSKTGKNFTTDSHISVQGLPCAIAEIKDDVGNTGADPYLQATLYYLESTRNLAARMESTSLPCMIIYIFGPFVGFAGAAWNSRPVIQSFFMHAMIYNQKYDTLNMAKQVARCLVAFKKAVRTLEQYHRNVIGIFPDAWKNPSQLFPYPTRFVSLQDGRPKHFRYTYQPFEDKCIFYGRIRSEERDVCLKFVRQYSKEAHEVCASLGCAPALRGFETMPGGWFMVVMDKLDPKEYVEFRDSSVTHTHIQKIRENLRQLHERGYIHGDVRDSNIMLSRTDWETCIFIGFDLAGEIGKVRDPAFVKKGERFWQPDRVTDRELVLAEDDMAMLDHIEERIQSSSSI